MDNCVTTTAIKLIRTNCNTAKVTPNTKLKSGQKQK